MSDDVDFIRMEFKFKCSMPCMTKPHLEKKNNKLPYDYLYTG